MSWFIKHHGIKGQKWGVRNGPPYPLEKKVAKTENHDTIKVYGHKDPPRQIDTPNAVIDHVGKNGDVKTRSFYDENGVKTKDIHTGHHSNPKNHDYGNSGEHVHEYYWKDNGELDHKTTRELTPEEREENGDIL